MIKMHKNIPLFFIFVFFVCVQSSFAQSGLTRSVYFKTNSFVIEKKYFSDLNEIAEKCMSDTSFQMKIFAFSDKTGSEEYNDELSKKRGEAVYSYLYSRTHFDTVKVYCEWLGESNDSYGLHFPEAHLQKRCVDILVQFYKK